MNNKNFSEKESLELKRMQALMNYGRVNEAKESYSGIECTREGADHRTYAIIREGAHYNIKVSDKKNPLVEDFDYLGGFRNRKNYEYHSFASALKNFDMKMKSINEAYRTPDMVIESWENKGENNQVITESTKKMQDEIARQREIMMNVNLISESKPQVLKKINEKSCASAPFCDEPDDEFKKQAKENIEKGKVGTGDAKKANDDYKDASLKGTDIKENEVLGFNRGNDDYMDKSHGTEIGDSAPFDDAEGRDIDDDKKTTETGELKNGVVEEGVSMHDTDNQNSPAPGTGEVGDNAPFDGEKGKDIDEAIEDLETDVDVEDDDVDSLGDDEEIDDVEDVDVDDTEDVIDDVDDTEDVEDVEDTELDVDDEEESVEERLDALEDLMRKIAEKMGVETYGDEELYDEPGDEESEEFDEFDGAYDGEDADGDDESFDFEVSDTEEDDDEEEPIEDCMTFESKAYRAMKLREAQKRQRKVMNEETRLGDFGKHPAYQKKVMTLPQTNMAAKDGYYDMNDDSVESEAPYGQQIGDAAPFDVDVETITNAIAESIKRVLKKK